MDVNEVADAIGVRLVGPMPHGESAGAFEVCTADGTRAVLKLDTGDVLDIGDTDRFAEALRARGYPIPSTLGCGRVEGCRYELQVLAPGRPLEQLTRGRLAPVLALNALQRDVRVRGATRWGDTIVSSVLDGCTGYCEHGAMRAYSPETRALLDRLCRIADAARHADVTDDDVVHYDFSPLNVLVDGDQVTAVVDWGGAQAGDASFDLVTMAFYTYEYDVRDGLLDAAAGATDARAVALYAAHMVLRQVDWSLRHQTATDVDWFMGIGEALLGRVAS